MKIRDGAHLTYCTNVHAAQTARDVWTMLQTKVLAVRSHLGDALGPCEPFSVGLRLSAEAAHELDDGTARLRDWLDEHQLYVHTLNGFPYGRFHGTPVKEAVYRPDWAEQARVEYTRALARILAGLLPDNLQVGNISTVPGCFRRRASPHRRQAIACNIATACAQLWEIRESTGQEIVLGLEPEPACMLETVSEVVTFLLQEVYAGSGLSRFVELTGLGRAEGTRALRRHLGACVDLCHLALEFGDPRAAIELLRAEDVRVAKVQISSGLQIDQVNDETVKGLAAFDDGVYLHQVTSHGHSLRRYVDLDRAITDWRAHHEPGQQWRVHVHVPVFFDRSAAWKSTRDVTLQALQTIREAGLCTCLEVETYTWHVLPHPWRDQPVEQAIARELQWAVDAWNG